MVLMMMLIVVMLVVHEYTAMQKDNTMQTTAIATLYNVCIGTDQIYAEYHIQQHPLSCVHAPPTGPPSTYRSPLEWIIVGINSYKGVNKSKSV